MSKQAAQQLVLKHAGLVDGLKVVGREAVNTALSPLALIGNVGLEAGYRGFRRLAPDDMMSVPLREAVEASAPHSAQAQRAVRDVWENLGVDVDTATFGDTIDPLLKANHEAMMRNALRIASLGAGASWVHAYRESQKSPWDRFREKWDV